MNRRDRESDWDDNDFQPLNLLQVGNKNTEAIKESDCPIYLAVQAKIIDQTARINAARQLQWQILSTEFPHLGRAPQQSAEGETAEEIRNFFKIYEEKLNTRKKPKLKQVV